MVKIHRKGTTKRRLLFECECGCVFSTYDHKTEFEKQYRIGVVTFATAECPECGREAYRSWNIPYLISDIIDEGLSKIGCRKEGT